MSLIQKNAFNVYANYSSSIVTPKLIRLTNNLTIALFELMKLVPAKYVIMKALAENKINPDYPIVETSSGTFALGMGIVCAELKLPFLIISDPVIDKTLESRLKALGGQVQIVSSTVDQSDVQVLRLEQLNDYLKNNKQAFWPSQYNKADNRLAYYNFAEQLLESLGSQFTLISAVGSGGSSCGTIERLRQTNKNIKLVGVDTFGSVLFGLEKNVRKLRGLGNSIMPKNLIHEYFDQVHWMTADCAYKSTRVLHEKNGLYCGPTTGAAYHVAQWLAENNPDEQFVMISPDSGHRYATTIYDDFWLTHNHINLSGDYSTPKCLNNLADIKEPWSYLNWNRKSYSWIKNTSLTQ